MSYGFDDTYAPEETQLALVKSIGLSQWPFTTATALENVQTIPTLPHTATHTYSGTKVTTVVVQYQLAKGKDGHFVMFEALDAEKQVTEFVRTMVVNGVPTLINP